MKEGEKGINSIAALRELKRHDKFPNVWVLKNEETSKIPSRFFTETRNEGGEALFEEHSIKFPIEDPAQLLASLEAFDVLYKAQAGPFGYAYDKDNPTLFIRFIGSFVGDKQSEAKS